MTRQAPEFAIGEPKVMGILDAPAPLFNWLDDQLAGLLPPVLRLLLWGVVAGVVSMLLYRAISPQASIARGKAELLAARRALDGYDGDFEGARPLMRRLLRVAVGQVGRTGWPGLLASLPVLFVLAWLSNAYGYAYPAPGSAPRIDTTPAQYETQWLAEPTPRILVNEGAQVVADVPLQRPVPVVHKPRWWNVLLGNPAGYLPRDAAVDHIRIDLPPKQYLAFGPDWLRGWAPTFFTALLAASIALKVLARIE